jgi:UDP-GlcNAc:undecaprenyl-phosphate GlcNAc-1-phosphate transferase
VRWYLLVAVIAAVVSFGFTWLIWKLSDRFRFYPKIRDRDVHTTPTPRLGGIAIFLGLLVAVSVSSHLSEFGLVFADPGPIYAILGAALLMVVVGAIDDIVDLDWMIKLAAQILAAGLLAWQGVQIVSLPFGEVIIGSPLMGLFITIFLVVLTMNAVNFIDGLDGLVAGVAIIANSVFFVYTALLTAETASSAYFNLSMLITAVLVGACAGFLPLNWHPAKLFMGDSGALLVGLLMATSALAVTGQINPASIENEEIGRSDVLAAFIPVLLPIAILILPLLDFSLAVLRRLRAGRSPFSADRLHLHHRLLDLGHGHLQTVLIFYAWTAVFSIGLLLAFILQPWYWALLFLLVGLGTCTVITFWPVIAPRLSRTTVKEPS